MSFVLLILALLFIVFDPFAHLFGVFDPGLRMVVGYSLIFLGVLLRLSHFRLAIRALRSPIKAIREGLDRGGKS